MGFDIMVVRIVVHIFKRDPNDVRIPISDGKYRFMSRIPLIQKTTRTTGYARHLPIPSSEAILRIVTSRISMIQSRYIVNATYEVNAMGKRLRIYVTDMDKALNMKNMSEEELAALRAEMCVQIGFFSTRTLGSFVGYASLCAAHNDCRAGLPTAPWHPMLRFSRSVLRVVDPLHAALLYAGKWSPETIRPIRPRMPKAFASELIIFCISSFPKKQTERSHTLRRRKREKRDIHEKTRTSMSTQRNKLALLVPSMVLSIVL